MATTNRRESQKDWYHNRGRVRMNVPCSGSNQVPLKVTDEGDYSFEGRYNRASGDLPRGLCSGCNDEISLVPRADAPTEDFPVRKHKDPAAPYRRQMLVSEMNYGRLCGVAAKHGLEPDEFLDQLLEEHLPKPSDKNRPTLI